MPVADQRNAFVEGHITVEATALTEAAEIIEGVTINGETARVNAVKRRAEFVLK